MRTLRTLSIAALLLPITLALAAMPAEASGCRHVSVDGRNGLQIADADIPNPPGQVCRLNLDVYTCEFRGIDTEGGIWWHRCQRHDVDGLLERTIA